MHQILIECKVRTITGCNHSTVTKSEVTGRRKRCHYDCLMYGNTVCNSTPYYGVDMTAGNKVSRVTIIGNEHAV